MGIQQFKQESHEYNIILYKTSDYECKQEKHNDIHPAIPGCRPGTYPKTDEEEGRTPTQVNIALTSSHWKPAAATNVVVSVSHEDSAIP